MKTYIAALVAFAGALLVTPTAHASAGGQVCGYTVASAFGVNCPVRVGQTACLSISTAIGPCDKAIDCFGGSGSFCRVRMIPSSGPRPMCPASSVRPRGLNCFASQFLLPTRTPTSPPDNTPTVAFTPTNTPPPDTSTPTGTPPASTATVTTAPATQTATTLPATATETATAQIATATSTGTPAGTTATATVTVTAAAATATTTFTAVATATATGTAAAATATGTVTPVGATATVTNTVAAATATQTNTVAAATATQTNTIPGSTATSTATAPPATATRTATVPPSTATNTATVPAATATTTATVPASTATATATVPPATATATRTATPPPSTPTSTATSTTAPCPLSPGAYTTTQVAGGTLQVYSFAPFAFPVGGTIVQDVAAASQPSCVHNTIVPFPGGFNAPNFCVQALMFTTSVVQEACGIGRIDSNGGSDFNTATVADTSDNTTCNLPHLPCTNGANSGVRVDITVGDGNPDTCSNGGSANALVTIPVHTTSWVDQSGGTFMGCQGNGVFGPGDMVAAEFDQILDFTTDSATGKWQDLNADGCSIAGFGPAAGFTASGTTETKCIDLTGNTVTVGAVGEFGATGGLFDGSFKTVLPSSVSGPGAPLGAACASPPVINYAGTATRCIP